MSNQFGGWSDLVRARDAEFNILQDYYGEDVYVKESGEAKFKSLAISGLTLNTIPISDASSNLIDSSFTVDSNGLKHAGTNSKFGNSAASLPAINQSNTGLTSVRGVTSIAVYPDEGLNGQIDINRTTSATNTYRNNTHVFQTATAGVISAMSASGLSIGTSSIGSRLLVYNNDTDTSSDVGLTIQQANSSGDCVMRWKAGSDFAIGVSNSDPTKLKFCEDATVESSATLVIDASNSCVGINTSSPTAHLHVTSDSANIGLQVDATSSGNCLELRNTGTGYCLLIEDNTNPDSTNTRIDQHGQIFTNSAIKFDGSLKGLDMVGSGVESSMIMDFDTSNTATNCSTQLRFFRQTNSGTSTTSLLINKADGTSAYNHLIAANSNSYMCVSSGSLTIGASSADQSAKFEVHSSNQGFLPPRMTEAQRDAIASPAEGLMIYNTTAGLLNFYNGVTWGAI